MIEPSQSARKMEWERFYREIGGTMESPHDEHPPTLIADPKAITMFRSALLFGPMAIAVLGLFFWGVWALAQALAEQAGFSL